MSFSKIATALSLVLVATTVACNGQVADEPEAASKEDGAVAITADGLTLSSQKGDVVEGLFSRHGETVGFELRPTVSGGRIVSITDKDGRLVLESTLEGGIETTTLLGKLRVRGPVDAEKPDVDGDPRTWDEVNADPAMKLVPELKEALRAKGVDPSYFTTIGVDAKQANGGVKASQWQDVWGYTHLSFGESRNFPTWAFWAVTTVELKPEASCTAARLTALTGWSAPEYTGMFCHTTIYVRRQYWGVYLNVANNAMPLSGQSTNLMVRTY